MLWLVIVMCLTSDKATGASMFSSWSGLSTSYTKWVFSTYFMTSPSLFGIFRARNGYKWHMLNVLLKNSFVGLNPALLVSFTNAHFRALPPRPAIFTPSLFILRLTLARKFARILPNNSKKKMEQGLRMFREKGEKSKLKWNYIVNLDGNPALFIINLKYISQNMCKIDSIYQNFINFQWNFIL